MYGARGVGQGAMSHEPTAEEAKEKGEKGKKGPGPGPDGNRTRNLRDWNPTRCHCATEPLSTSGAGAANMKVFVPIVPNAQ